MSNKFNTSIINVYGDTLESCVYARMLAETRPNLKIRHYSSSNLGGIYVNSALGLLTEKQMLRVLEYMPEYEFTPVTETYVRIPYNKLKIKNTTDGNIRFPFTVKSFESEYDYDDVVLSTPTFDEFMDRCKANKNIVKTMKEIFQDSFYVDVAKKIGTNLFDVIQSQLDPKYIYKQLFNMESLSYDDYLVYYTPVNGFEDLCVELLKHENIEMIITDRKSIRDKLNGNNEMNYVFDYFDYYLNFIFGPIEYYKFTSTEYKKTLYNTEFISRTYTPYDKKYGLYYQIENTIYAVSTRSYAIRCNIFDNCIPKPTITNVKKIAQYLDLVSKIPNINIIY